MRVAYLVSVWLHVLAAMTWVGGMLTFVAAAMPWARTLGEEQKSAFLQDFGRRFRFVTWTAFAMLTVTGTFNLWVRGIRIPHLLGSEWWLGSFGGWLALKLSLFLIAIVILVVHERDSSPVRARWLGRLSLLLGVEIVALAVRLVRVW